MRKLLEMPDITACDVTACAYNVDARCRARAITVGDGVHPACDTYLPARHHVRADETTTAGVGACKVSACRFNDEYECSATAIRVVRHLNHADCATYTPL